MAAPTPIQAFIDSLETSAGVSEVVGQNIFPDEAAEGATEPYLVYQQTAEVQRQGMRGPCGSIRAEFELAGFCATRSQAVALKAALFALFNVGCGPTPGVKQYFPPNTTLLWVSSSMIGAVIDDEGMGDSSETPRAGEGQGLRVVRGNVTWFIPPGQ